MVGTICTIIKQQYKEAMRCGNTLHKTKQPHLDNLNDLFLEVLNSPA